MFGGSACTAREVGMTFFYGSPCALAVEGALKQAFPFFGLFPPGSLTVWMIMFVSLAPGLNGFLSRWSVRP